LPLRVRGNPTLTHALIATNDYRRGKELSEFHDDGDAAHVAHAVARTHSRGTRITKVSKHSTWRIDLAVAAVMAHARAAELAAVPALRVF